ncbi:MAG: DUF1566 domain-containing protein [Desulfobulbaceae bacterium]|nr:DUF1566 domain-containing protein [Desulfobulbaceae bacterium]
MKTLHLGLVFLLVAVSACATLHQPDEMHLIRLDNGIIEDAGTGLQWQLDKSPRKFDTLEKAAQYAGSLDLGGHHDWRLPTLGERWDLLQLFVLKKNGGVEFPLFAGKYWTTETDMGAQPIKLDITCMCRGDQEIEYKNEGYVRAVRGSEVAAK